MRSRKKILYVDDYADNRRLVRRLLEAEGYAFVEAQDGQEALNKLQDGRLDLALIDVNLPDINGYTLSAKIHRIPGFHRLPIIAVTAGDGEHDDGMAAKANCDGYIQKPFDVESLLREIKIRLQ